MSHEPNVVKLFTTVIYKCSYQEKVFDTGWPLQPSQMFVSKVGCYLTEVYFICSTLGWALGLAIKHYTWIERPGRENTLAYYKHLKITAVKSFKDRAQEAEQQSQPAPSLVKLFCRNLQIYELS